MYELCTFKYFVETTPVSDRSTPSDTLYMIGGSVAVVIIVVVLTIGVFIWKKYALFSYKDIKLWIYFRNCLQHRVNLIVPVYWWLRIYQGTQIEHLFYVDSKWIVCIFIISLLVFISIKSQFYFSLIMLCNNENVCFILSW